MTQQRNIVSAFFVIKRNWIPDWAWLFAFATLRGGIGKAAEKATSGARADKFTCLMDCQLGESDSLLQVVGDLQPEAMRFLPVVHLV